MPKIRDIIGSLGILPRLAVKEYDRQQDKMREGENAIAQLAAMQSAQGGAPTGMKKGGKVKKMAAGGSVSKRADGCAVKGKTRGKMV